jgi:MFS family permease
MTREERKIIGVTTAAHGLNHGFILIFAAVLPILQSEFATDFFHLGLIGNICFLAFGLGSLPTGILADRIGTKRLISIYLFGAAASSFLVAFSGPALC